MNWIGERQGVGFAAYNVGHEKYFLTVASIVQVVFNGNGCIELVERMRVVEG